MYEEVDIISATFVEKDIITINLIEKEVISVQFNTIDVVKSLETITNVIGGLIQEVPTILASLHFETSKLYGAGEIYRFETSLPYVSGSLKFYLNGLKEQQSGITEISTTVFEISEPILADDDFEVEYVELT